jgi:inosine-uridine nucleoside N-ribohydrolase
MRGLRLLGAVLGLARVVSAGTVWIDTDVSIGSPIREVDDAYALVLAFHSPELRIAGISTSYGNAPVGQTTRAVQELVRRFGAPANVTAAKVFRGAGSAAERGRPGDASEALATALRKEAVTYIALGPLTNLATLLQVHPKLAHRIDRVIFLGGQLEGTTLALGPNGSFRIHDANVFKDPAAAEAVLRSNLPVTLIPVSAAKNLMMTREDLRELERNGEAGNYLARQSKVWIWFWTNFVRTKGGPIFDALAVAGVARPGLLAVERRYARMDEARDLVVTRRSTKGARSVTFCSGFAPGTKAFVIERLVTRRGRE